jgi:hypothetical protein
VVLVICLNIKKIFKSTQSLFCHSPNIPELESDNVAAVNSSTELLFVSVDSILNFSFLPAEKSECENLPIGDSDYGESEKGNETGKESSKSTDTSVVVHETEEEMKFRNKYLEGKA